MAGKKITELPELGTTPANGDWLVVVDVSDTSESAEGTTKKVLKSNAIVSQIDQGEWTPNIQTDFNGATSIKATYVSYGEYVDIVCKINIDNTSLTGDNYVSIEVPDGLAIDTSDDENANGVICLQQATFTTFIHGIQVKANAAGVNGSVLFSFESVDPASEYIVVLMARYKRA